MRQPSVDAVLGTMPATARTLSRVIPMIAAIVLMMAPSLATTIVRIAIKKAGAGPLFQIHHGKKWGYMDRNGKTAIPPQFDDEGDFFNDRAKVQIGNKWGYIDEAGRVVVQPRFDNAGDFSESLAPVQIGRKWGFIELSGTFVVAPEFQAAEFHEGLARFELWDTIRCSIDYRRTGPDLYSKADAPLRAFRLHDSAATSSGCFSDNVRYGYIDKGGKIVIAPKFAVASDFSQGLAAVRETGSSELEYGYIDKMGKMVIQPRFNQASPFSENLAAVAIDSGVREGGESLVSWGFINRAGAFEIQAKFRLAHSFSEGMADVSLPDGTWGYLDRYGKFVIPERYLETNPFSGGLALVWPNSGDESYYIDKTGRKALSLRLGAQWSFSDGLTVAGKEGERKYVDRKGKIVAAYEVDPQI